MKPSDLPSPSDDVTPESSPGIERESLSSVELPSSLKDRLAAAWKSREPKFYERLAPAQKHWVDKLVAIRLEEFQAHLVSLDREDSELSHQIGELSAQVVQLSQRLSTLEERLESPEDEPVDDAKG